MKKSAVIITTLLLSIFLSACSYSVNFAAINESDETIEVEYVISMQSYRAHGHESEVPAAFIPSTVSLEKWENSPRAEEWKPLPETEYQVDLQSERFIVKLPPRSALKIVQLNDSSVFFEDSYKKFEIKKIMIKGKNGSVSYEGEQVLKNFSEKKYTERFISYK